MVNFTQFYETSNVMYTFGNDFAFYDAGSTFGMMDDIIRLVESKTDLFEFQYSSVGEYVKSVKKERKEKNLAMQVFHDDFFPIEQSYKNSFWTGYFTTRPNSKFAFREFSKLTEMVDQLYALDYFRVD